MRMSIVCNDHDPARKRNKEEWEDTELMNGCGVAHVYY